MGTVSINEIDLGLRQLLENELRGIECAICGVDDGTGSRWCAG